ncbi:diguanylate cyclase [Nissabacter archeti]|uniref:GGDEF domain-containing protein n=1 Tax=Nissabacter archeti TaxID=1917880 RepID=UPI0030B806B2
MMRATNPLPSIFRSSLGRSMVIFLIIMSIAVVGINGWTLWDSYDRTLRATHDQAKNLSVSLARQAEDTFLQVEITLTDIAREISGKPVASDQLEALRSVLRGRQAILPQLHGLFIYDAEGNWLATSGNTIPVNANNADREYFIWHRTHADPEIHIGKVIRSRSTGDLVIPVSLRLTSREGRFAGVALATVSIDYFRQHYSYYVLSERSLLGLFMADSTVMYVRPFPDSVINTSLSSSPLFTHALKASASGSGAWRSAMDNEVRIFGYARLNRYPLIVAAGYDKRDIQAQWRADNLLSVVLSLSLLAALFLLGFFVLRQVRVSMKNHLEMTQLRDDLTTINHTLQALALVDGLTGLANRRQFDIFLEQSLQRSARNQEPVSLIMMDIDFFKRYNDAYGHVAGDECLKKVGEALLHLPHRQSDLIARYGGEEFAIVLPYTGIKDAAKFAQRAVEAVRAIGLPHAETDVPGKIVTISAGSYSCIVKGNGPDARAFKEHADQALYQAKHSGRNCGISTEG